MRVDGTGPLTYKAFRLNEPDRLVIDFSGAVVRVQERSLSSSLFPVRLVRIGQFQPNVARVVIEIAEQLPYTIAASKNAVTVVFNPATVAKPPITTDKEMPYCYCGDVSETSGQRLDTQGREQSGRETAHGNFDANGNGPSFGFEG